MALHEVGGAGGVHTGAAEAAANAIGRDEEADEDPGGGVDVQRDGAGIRGGEGGATVAGGGARSSL